MGSDDEVGYDRGLFGDDDGDGASIIASDDDTDTRRRSAGDTQSKRSDKGSGDEDNEKKDEEKDTKKPLAAKRKGPVRHVLLDEDTLCGRNGLIKIEEVFKDFKFLGKGHEQQDLDRVLHKLEHWVHVLHPRYPFDQTLERIEYLGAKKPRVKTYVKKIRMGLISTTEKEDDFLNLVNDLSSDDNADVIGEAPQGQQTSEPTAGLEPEFDDQFPDDFPDIPEEMLLDDNF